MLSNSGRSHCLFNTLARPPAHLPEIGLEPGGFLEDRDQLGLAGLLVGRIELEHFRDLALPPVAVRE